MAAALREAVNLLKVEAGDHPAKAKRAVKRCKSDKHAAAKSALGDRIVSILEDAKCPMRMADICEQAKAPIWNVREAVVTLEAAASVVRVSGGVKTMYARPRYRNAEAKAS